MHISNLVDAYLIDLLAGRTKAQTIITKANEEDASTGCKILAYLLNHTFRSDIFMSEIIDAPPSYVTKNEKDSKLIRLVWKDWIENNHVPLERDFYIAYDQDVMSHIFFLPNKKPPFHRDILDLPHEFRKAWMNTPKKDQKTIAMNILPAAAVFNDLLKAMSMEDYNAVYDVVSKVFVVTRRDLPRY